jgi:four helix bundle protein
MLIAMGSASELEYHLLLAHGLGYLAKDYQKLFQQTREAKRMLSLSLSTFINKLRHNKPTS